ncbi:MAG: calcium/sodium antiporter [Polyangiaceae bacterium]|nr:calcium/sodium antiporter [Polyangiaceae bacterium]
MDWVKLIGGGMLLYFGAEWFVGGASALALALRIPQILVGLTVVAYGTSAPEVIVGIEAARDGHGDVAIGNVVGSNIANIGLILGIAALIKPARVDGSLRRREMPVMLLSTALVPLVLMNGKVEPWEAFALLAMAVAYTGWMVRSARSAVQIAAATADTTTAAEATDAAGAPKPGGRWRSAITALVGLVVLLVGGKLFVAGAVSAARSLGISEKMTGLTIVAVGTSLPELITSIIAARKGHSDLAVGNVLGSNIFNVFLCLGASALAGTVAMSLVKGAFDLVVLSIMTLLAALFIRTERLITRLEGWVLVALYSAFMVLTIVRG